MNGNYVTMKLPSGKTTTVHKDNAQKFSDMGYEIGGTINTPSKNAIDRYVRDDTSGSNFQDSNTNNGFVRFEKDNGSYISVNARYADKYFDKGYGLHSSSQSVNRALDSEYHKTNDRMNEAIRGGSYNPNFDYSIGTSNGGRYDYNGNNNQYLNSINKALQNIGVNNINQQSPTNSTLGGLLQGVFNGENNNLSDVDKLIQELNQYKQSYNQNSNNYVENNFVGNNGLSANYGNTSLNNQNIVPGQIFISNSGKKIIRENGMDREMSDDEVVKYLDSLYGF